MYECVSVCSIQLLGTISKAHTCDRAGSIHLWALWYWHTQNRATSTRALPETSFVNLLPCLAQPFAPNAADAVLHGSMWRIHAAEINLPSKSEFKSLIINDISKLYISISQNGLESMTLSRKKGNSLRLVFYPVLAMLTSLCVYIYSCLYICTYKGICVYIHKYLLFGGYPAEILLKALSAVCVVISL